MPTTKTLGRWRYEQLAPLELCGLHVDLGRMLGPSLRSALMRLLSVLGAAPEPGEALAARAARVMGAIEAHDGIKLAEYAQGLMARPWDELVGDLDVLSVGLVEACRALDGRQVRALMLDVLVHRADRPRGGLSFQVVAGAKEYVKVDSREALDEQLANDHSGFELWRLFAWALLVNLHPSMAAWSSSLARPTTPSPPLAAARTPGQAGPSTA